MSGVRSATRFVVLVASAVSFSLCGPARPLATTQHPASDLIRTTRYRAAFALSLDGQSNEPRALFALEEVRDHTGVILSSRDLLTSGPSGEATSTVDDDGTLFHFFDCNLQYDRAPVTIEDYGPRAFAIGGSSMTGGGVYRIAVDPRIYYATRQATQVAYCISGGADSEDGYRTGHMGFWATLVNSAGPHIPYLIRLVADRDCDEPAKEATVSFGYNFMDAATLTATAESTPIGCTDATVGKSYYGGTSADTYSSNAMTAYWHEEHPFYVPYNMSGSSSFVGTSANVVWEHPYGMGGDTIYYGVEVEQHCPWNFVRDECFQ